MAFNGAGTWNLPAGQPVVSGTVISSTTHNNLVTDLQTALGTCVLKDGQQTITDNIPFNSNKITGLASGTATGDAVAVGDNVSGLNNDANYTAVGDNISDFTNDAGYIANIADPPDASDTGTDAYEADLGGDLSTGDTFVADIDSANTTASPTFENTGGDPSGAQSLVDVDGNARIGMIEARPHRIQWDGTNYVLLDPQPLRPSVTSSGPGLAFDTWRTPNANRPVLAIINVRARTDSSSTGQITVDVDESGGTSADYSINAVTAHSNLPDNTVVDNSVTVFIPAGGSYRISNATDPKGTNEIRVHREWVR